MFSFEHEPELQNRDSWLRLKNEFDNRSTNPQNKCYWYGGCKTDKSSDHRTCTYPKITHIRQWQNEKEYPEVPNHQT